MRVANQVDDSLLQRWSRSKVPETRERVLVCISRPAFAEKLIRRGARLAQRAHGDLLVVHVHEGGEGENRGWLESMNRLVRDLGGTFEVLNADDPVEAILGFAYRQFVTQIVVGEPLRSFWRELLRGAFVNRLIRKAGNLDIHVIARRER
jgi:two-component system sensor histidine kinase KdpD